MPYPSLRFNGVFHRRLVNFREAWLSLRIDATSTPRPKGQGFWRAI